MKSAAVVNLSITAIPFRSSRLAAPPSPFSPRLPITPPAHLPLRPYLTDADEVISLRKTLSAANPAPKSPLGWVWQCHMCHLRYPLGVTRRCLDDGHFFCAGTTVVRIKRGKMGEKKVLRRHNACSSEFDYQGWQAWGNWRRKEEERTRRIIRILTAQQEKDNGQQQTVHAPSESGTLNLDGRKEKNCWLECNYPSECRWGAQASKQSDSLTPTGQLVIPKLDVVCNPTKTHQRDLDCSNEQYDRTVATTFDTILEKVGMSLREDKADEKRINTQENSGTKESLWNTLRSSTPTSRRKSLGAPSPLSLAQTPGHDEPFVHSGLNEGKENFCHDADGDTLMANAICNPSTELLDTRGDLQPLTGRPLLTALSALSRTDENDTSRNDKKLRERSTLTGRKRTYVSYVDVLRKHRLP